MVLRFTFRFGFELSHDGPRDRMGIYARKKVCYVSLGSKVLAKRQFNFLQPLFDWSSIVDDK